MGIIKNTVKGHLIIGLMTVLLLPAFSSCDQQGNGDFVINEIMASNHSSVMAKDGELHDWIEIKNISGKPSSLAGYSLVVEKNANDSEEGSEVKQKSWDLPAVELKAGECVVIFASKKNSSDPKGELHAGFKLSSKGGKVQLLKGGSVISEIEYSPLEDDQCLKRQDDGSYIASYEATPGADNNDQGLEQCQAAIEGQRTGSLRVWELYPKGNKNGEAWVEIKNVSDSTVNLQDYFLTTSKKDMNQYQLPNVELQPGAFYVVNGKEAGLKLTTYKTIALTRDGKFVDGLCAPPTPKGISIGHVAGKNGIFFFKSPTSGAENTTPSSRKIESKDDDEEEDDE